MNSLLLTWMLTAAGPAQAPELTPNPGTPRFPTPAASAPASDIVAINKRSFKIPILIDPQRRPQIKQLILFVSTDQGQTWNQEVVRTPDQDHFPFRAQADGPYWFKVAIIDQQDNQQPPDIYKVPPNQKILVDTTAPELKFKSVDRQGEEIQVLWEIAEENPDLNTLRLEYRATNSQSALDWQPVQIAPEQTGKATIRVAATTPVSIRMEMRDLAGNTGNASKDVPAGPPQERLTSAPPASPAGPALGSNTAVNSTSGSPLGNPPANLVPDHGAPPAPSTLPGRADLLPTNLPGNDAGNRVVAWSSNTDVGTSAVPGTSGLPRPPLPNVFVVNDPQISLEYEVMKFGSSGVGKVELYLTEDDGKTWRVFADDPDLKSPITARLPGQGVFGLRLVTTSGAGLTEGPPQAGDAPEMRIEVDLTPPAVQLYEPKPDPQHADTLIISWNATDRNLAAKPVALEYAEKLEDNGWKVIAAGQPGNGSFSWQPPKQLARVYFRITALDTAGNRSVAETRESILVDLNKPKGRLVGIAPTVRPQP